MSLVFVLVVYLNLVTGQPMGSMEGLAASASECNQLAQDAISKAADNAPPPSVALPVTYCLELPKPTELKGAPAKPAAKPHESLSL